MYSKHAALLFATLLFSTSMWAAQTNSALAPIDSNVPNKLFSISGSNTLGSRLVPAWAKSYLAAKGLENLSIHTRSEENEFRVSGSTDSASYYIDIAAHGSSTGFKALLARSANIAMSSRPIKKREIEKLAHLGNMRDFSTEHVVAIDGLAIIVNPSNPIDKLSTEQLGKIFSGEIKNWAMVGGQNRPIKLFARNDQSGTWDTFKSLVLRKQYTLSPLTRRFESNDQLSKYVSSEPAGIGFVGLASVNNSKAIAISDEASLSALRPESMHVSTEDYPLARRLHLYSNPADNNDLIDEFIDFVQSTAGQNIVTEIGFVSQVPIKVTPEADLKGPKDYLHLVSFGKRLSVNFRFNTGSAELDNKAKRDILRIAQYMQDPSNANNSIQLIGFGDLKQSDRRARILSKLRASAVKSALYSYGVVSESVTGFGSDLPVASNLGSSKLKNQRVEVWLYDKSDKSRLEQAKKNIESHYARNHTTDFAASPFKVE